MISAMRNLKFTLRYDGTDFCGWQTQPDQRTVQGTLEDAIFAITRERVRANCAGRTDSGVHADGQVCNFFTATRLDTARLVKAVNSQLPDDVAVVACEEASQAFCANKDAVAKRYRYVINDTRVPNPFLRRYAYQPRRNVNHEVMHRAAQVLLGRHDFRCFETEWPNRLTSIRTIQDISVTRHGESVHIEVQADGFLYNMVRAIAGTLHQIGRGYWPEAKMKEVLDGMDRREAGPTAPAQGLFMLWVRYS
jgi:tRNA pseudouridine38-40 synthase